MKLRRILALVVSLAMVLSVVPAFSLTASAAVEAPASGAFEHDFLENLVTYAPVTIDHSGNNNYNDADLNANWGWSKNTNGTLTANLKTYDGHDTLQLYNNAGATNYSSLNLTTSQEIQTATANKDYFVIEFLTHYSNGLSDGNTITIYSNTSTGTGAPGNSSEFLKFKYGKNGVEPCTVAAQNSDTYGTSITGGQANFVPVRAYIAKNAAGTYDVIWRVKNSETGKYETKQTVKGLAASRATNGFKTLRCYFRVGNYTHVGFSDMKVYAGNYADVELPTTVKTVTATYTVNDEVVKTVERTFNTEEADGASLDAYYYSANGSNVGYYAEAQTIGESTTIVMSPVANNSIYSIGDSVGVGTSFYKVESANLIPNGNFAYGVTGWYNSAGGPAGSGFVADAAAGTVTNAADKGATDANSLWRGWATEVGKTYLFTFDSSAATGYFAVSEKDDLTTTGDGTRIGEATVAGTNTIVYTATKPYVQINFRWIAGKTMGNFGLYEVEQSTSVEVTATYTVNGEVVHTAINAYELGTSDSAVFDEYYYSAGNGTNTLYKADAQTLSESTTIEMSAVENWSGYAVNDSVVAGNNTPYLIKSANLIPNGNFAEGINGWYAGDGNAATTANFTVNTANGSVFTVGSGGSGSAYSLQRSWAIENGKTYIFVYTQDSQAEGRKWQRFSLGNTFASNNDAMLSGAGANDVETGQSVVYGTNIVAFTNTDGYQYANFIGAWNQNTSFSNFGLYEAEVDTARIATTTVKFVNSADNAEIKDAVVINGVVGDTINLADIAPAIIEYNGKYYTKDNTNADSFVAEGNTNTVNVTYTVDPITSFTGTPVTVIEGNTPVLSETVMGATDGGIETAITGITWEDCSGLAVGTHTVNGTATVAGETVNGTVEVTVLPLSFAPGDLAETNNGTSTFPVKVYGDFYVEFDFAATNFDNEWIYIGADGKLWGDGQIGLGWDADNKGLFRAQPAEQTDITFETNKTYRFLVHGNVDTDTYDLVVYDTVTKEVVFTCEDYGFRKGSDYVNTIVATSNGQAGSAALSNVKVYSEAIKPATVTFEYINNGTVINTVVQNTYTGETATVAAGQFDGTDGARYYADAAEVAVTETAHTVRVVAVKLETVTVNYVYNEEIIKTIELYGNIGTVANQAAFRFAKDTVVYDAPVFNQTIDAENPTYTVELAVVDNTIAATKSEIYNYTDSAVIPYPDRVPAMVGTDAMYSTSWDPVRYGEMVFNVAAAEGSAIAHATLTLTPFDRQAGETRTFDIYAVAPSNYGAGVDVTTLTRVGNGTFTDVEVPVTVDLDLYDFDASEGLMLIFKMTDGLMGVYGASFEKAPYLAYEVKEKTDATFTYVCEGVAVGSVTVRGFVGETASVNSGYFTAEDGTKYFVDASSITLTSGENTAEVNARKREKVTINYTIGGETVKTAVLEGFAGDAVIAPDVYVNRDKAVYWYEAKEYTLVDGGSEFEVELTLIEGAIYASKTETYNDTTKEVIAYPEDGNRNSDFFGTDAMFSASWGDVRYGEMLFDVTVPDGDVINSAQLTLTPGDWMNGSGTFEFDIYAANSEDYGEYIDLEGLTLVGRGRFTQNNTPVTVDLDLTRYEATEQVMLIYKMTNGLVGVYGASFGDNAPRLTYTTGELGARVEVSDEFVAEYAKGTLSDFDAVNPPVTITEDGYLDINTAWGENISGTNSPDGASHIDVYAASVNEPIIRVVSDLTAADYSELAPSTVTTPGYGEGDEYVLFTFNPEVGTAPWTDIGLRDIDGKLITAFRLNNSETDVICPIWGHIGTGTPYKTYFEGVDYSFSPAGEAKATVTDLVSQVDVLMRNFDPDGEADTGDEYYTVAFSVGGNVFAVGTYEGNFNGLKDIEMTASGATENQYGGIAAIKIYSGNEPRVIGSITANYVYEGEVVHSVTKYYDKYQLEAGEVASIDFPEYYYSALGSSLLYKVPARTLTEDTVIDVVQYHPSTGVVLTLIHNWSHDNLRPSDLYTNEETGLTYMIATRNLIPNGNFEHGDAAWYDGTLDELSEVEFVPTPSRESVIIRANGATTSEYGLYNAWALEKGATYLFTYKATGLNETYAGITQTDVADPVSYDSTVATPLVNGENQIVFEAESDFLKLNLGWSKDAEIGSFGLYKLEMIKTGDIHRTIIQGNSPMLPTHVAPEVDGEVHTITWDEDAIANLQLGTNTVTGTCDEGHTVTATVMVYPKTFDMNNITSMNSQYEVVNNGGNIKFEKPVTGKFAIEMDVTVEDYGDLWIILNDSEVTNDASFFGKDQILISPSYFGGEVKAQDGDKNGSRTVTDLMVAGRDKPYRFLIRGNCELGNYSLTVTTPEGITRTISKFGFRTMSNKLDSIAMLSNSGTGQFTATNIKVYDVEPIDLNVIIKTEENDKGLGLVNLGEYFYGEEVTIPEGKFYMSYYDEAVAAYGENAEADNVAHILKIKDSQSFNVKPEHSEAPEIIYAEIHKKNAVLYDTYATANADELNTAENLLFVGSNGVSDVANFDADGEATLAGVDKNVGTPRIPTLTFNIPTFNEGEVVMLNLYAYQANHLLGIGNAMKLAANTVDFKVDESTVYVPEDIVNTENLVWSDNMIIQTEETLSDGRYTVREDTRRVAIDVTDLVVKAKAEGKDRITFALYAPVAGAYIMNREATRYGAVHQGDFAAFLEVENDTYTITVNGASMVTKGGSKALLTEDGSTTVHLRNDRDVMLYSDNASEVVFAEADNVKFHNIANETTAEGNNVRRATVTSETIVDDGYYMPYTLGVDMVDGAQVRIGDGVDENGEFIGGSGLRFISVVNAADTLATFALEDADMEIGVKVTAEGSTQAVYIPAEKWQTDGSVFTSALTNLAASNYNRNFTAVPYIKCTDADGTELEYINAPVTRSIYKVASGLLTKGYDTEGDDNGVETDGNYKDDLGDESDYSEMPERLVAVLNAYVNKTGVRLTLSDNSETATLTARMTGSGAYTGEAFFTVGETTYADGKYTVTLTAVGQSVINTEIFNKYVRINNNNTKVSPVTEITDNGDGTYTIVFDYSNM